MNWLNFFTKLYSKERNIPGLPFWVMTPVRRLTKYAANKVLPRYLASSRQSINTHVNESVIVSFTSFPARINNVWKVVESLKAQSVRPEKIILWLSKEQFPHREDVPESLWKEEDDLFEVRMVDGDIRSHKKYYFVMQEFPDKTFVTCDDDIFYHPDTLKNLVEASRQFPGCVIANKTRKIGFADDGNLQPYNEWKDVPTAFESDNLIQIGVGGVLYPPRALHELTLRKDLFFTLTPMADDLWLNCMARLNGTPVVQSAMRMKPLAIKSNAPTLTQQNRGQNGNDEQLSRLKKYLKEEGLSDVYSSSHIITPPLERPIVSLTSYPARINDIWQVLECMMMQTFQPAFIILWLSKDQFPNPEDVPASLRRMEGDRFQIRFVEGDLRSHKKYQYMAQEYPDSLIFLIDDDLYYSTRILERTMKVYQENPNVIICNYGYHIAYKETGDMKPYNIWSKEYGYSTSSDLFFGSGGGTLFRPAWLYKDLTNTDLAMRLAPLADDIWLNAMARLAELPRIMVPNGNILPIPMKGKETLASVNRGENLNDKQLSQVIQYYIDEMGVNPFRINN